jgi:hypothetical protein
VTATDVFTYQALSMKVRLTELSGEASTLDMQRLLVLSTPGQRGLAVRVADLRQPTRRRCCAFLAGVPATQPATQQQPGLGRAHPSFRTRERWMTA